MGKLYIAYGSNLNIKQMAVRCPHADVAFTGYLNNWELIYRGRSSYFATIKRKKGRRVPVAVWNIQQEDEKNLDAYEGFPSFYRKERIYVTKSDGSRKLAMVYIMNEPMRVGKPSNRYESIIRQGYKDFGFDMQVFEDTLYKNWKEMQKRG